MALDVVTTYTKYKKSSFFKQAYNLCPNLHRGDDYCGLCESLVQALEKAYQEGRYDERDRNKNIQSPINSRILGEHQ